MNNEPALVVTPLALLMGKQIGCWVGNASAGDRKNISIGARKN
jgi:hypothetical protein